MTEQKEAQQAAERSVDNDALLEGEDPSSDLVEDAEHWISVYRELTAYKRTLLGTSAEEIAEFEHHESRGEAREVDVVILRTEANDRTLARVPADDKSTLARLLDLDRTPIGVGGRISTAADGVPEWQAA